MYTIQEIKTKKDHIKRYREVAGIEDYQTPYTRDLPKIGRNEYCPCGSGLKYKKCHIENN